MRYLTLCVFYNIESNRDACRHRLQADDVPDTDRVVGETTKQCLTVRRPGQRDAFRYPRRLGGLGRELGNNLLALEIEDLDAARSRCAEPVAVGREDERIDNVTGLERVEMLALVEVPEHCDTVLATGRGKRAVGRDGEGVDIAGMAVVVGAQLALGELPDLYKNVRQRHVDTEARRVRDLGGKVVSSDVKSSEVANIERITSCKETRAR